jgi:hypothetical protein
VRLRGTVDRPFERSRAEQIVSGIAGVLDVRNLLALADRSTRKVHDPYVDEARPEARPSRRGLQVAP